MLHNNRHNSDPKNGAKEGHRRRLCSNNVGTRCPSLGITRTFSSKEKHAIIELAKIFKRIHVRLIAEGYIIENGNIIPPKQPDL